MVTRIPKSKLDIWDTREETSLRKLAQSAVDQVSLDGLVDVDIASPDNGDVLTYDEFLGVWINAAPGTGALDLTDLGDVTITTPLSGQALIYNGTVWQNTALPSGTGTVTSVNVSGGTTGLTTSGGPVTGSGTITLGGTLGIENGGTGATTASAARAALGAGTGNGTVTSVDLALPGIFTVSGNPVTTSGTLTAALASQTQNLVWASPNGSPGVPTFRSLVSGDFPTNLQSWNAITPSSKQDTLVAGTNITIVGTTISATGGGSLTHFTESVNTSAPNATVPVCSLVANNAATNVDVVFAGKGTFALLSQIPDNTTTGGNKRGASAVDFQTVRSNAAQVALGLRSAIVNGQNNTTTSNGTNGFIGSGNGNTVSSSSAACVAGNSNTSSASSAFTGAGQSNTASGSDAAVVAGSSNQATGTRSFVGAGTENQATGENSWVPGGRQGGTRGIVSAYAWSGQRRSANFDNQCIGLPVQGSTSDATPAILTSDRIAAGLTTNTMVLPNNSCWTGTVHITGRSSGGDVYYLRLDVVGARGASAATTTVKAINPAYTFTDVGLTGVSATVVANTTRGSIEVQVTGLAATTIDWFAHFDAGNQIVR